MAYLFDEEDGIGSSGDGAPEDADAVAHGVPQPPPGQFQFPAADVQPQLFPGTPGDLSGNRDTTSGALGASTIINLGAPFGSVPQRPLPTVVPDFHKKAPWDPTGETWDNAFVQEPKRINDALEAGGQAVQDQSAATVKALDRQRTEQENLESSAQWHRIQNQRGYEQRMSQIQGATQKYAADLADRGKYWQNPGNILASVGAAIIAFSAGKNDPGIGVRIINQAVESDWNKRRALADMHLGELRSNLAAFRQIAGSREAGDAYALAYSTRIAQNELARIGAQFQGPQAKAAVARIQAEMNRNFQIQLMDANAKAFHGAHFQNPVLAAEEVRGGVPTTSFKPAYPGAKGPYQSPTTATANTAAPWLQNYMGDKTQAKATTAPGKVANAVVQSVSRSSANGKEGFMSEEQKAMIDRRSPGASDRIKAIRSDTVQSVLASIGVDPRVVNPLSSDDAITAQVEARFPGAGSKYNAAMAARRSKAAEDNKVVAAQMAPIAKRLTSMRALGKSIQTMEMVGRSLGVDMDTLREADLKQVIGPSLVKKWSEWAATSLPKNQYEAQRKEVSDAVADFDQLLSGNVSNWVQEKSGGTVTEGETKRNDQFINSEHSWRSIKGFQKIVSSETNAAAKVAIGSASDPLTKEAWRVEIGEDDPGIGYQGLPRYQAKPGADGLADDVNVLGKEAVRRVQLIRAAEALKKKGQAK